MIKWYKYEQFYIFFIVKEIARIRIRIQGSYGSGLRFLAETLEKNFKPRLYKRGARVKGSIYS